MRIGSLIMIAMLATAPAALALTQDEAAWQQSLKDDNAAYAVKPHAILKIADAAYIGEGEAQSLVGKPGNPASYHWVKGVVKNASFVASLTHGRSTLTRGGAAFDLDALGKGIPIAKDVDVAGAMTQIAPEKTGLRIFVYNQQSKEAKAFKGLDYFPYDPAYKVTASFKAAKSAEGHLFKTSRGTDKIFYHVGDATFTLQGKKIVLPFYADAKEPAKIESLASFFTDDLTGKVTYGAGRYVDVEGFGKFPPKTLTIDFNYAYNPNCARSTFYNCPYAVDAIPLAMKAGEKDPHTKH